MKPKSKPEPVLIPAWVTAPFRPGSVGSVVKFG